MSEQEISPNYAWLSKILCFLKFVKVGSHLPSLTYLFLFLILGIKLKKQNKNKKKQKKTLQTICDLLKILLLY